MFSVFGWKWLAFWVFRTFYLFVCPSVLPSSLPFKHQQKSRGGHVCPHKSPPSWACRSAVITWWFASLLGAFSAQIRFKPPKRHKHRPLQDVCLVLCLVHHRSACRGGGHANPLFHGRILHQNSRNPRLNPRPAVPCVGCASAVPTRPWNTTTRLSSVLGATKAPWTPGVNKLTRCSTKRQHLARAAFK